MTDSLFAGLGAFDAASGVQFTNEDETGKQATFLLDYLREVPSDAVELPQKMLHWLMEDPLFLSSNSEPAPRDWDRFELDWVDVKDDHPAFGHKMVTIDRRLSFGRQAQYRIHHFTATEGGSINIGIKETERVKNESEGILATNMGGYHSQRDLFSDQAYHKIQQLILDAVSAAEASDRTWWEEDELGEEGAPTANKPVREAMEGWVNISKKGDLNLLHHHSEVLKLGLGLVRVKVYYIMTLRC